MSTWARAIGRALVSLVAMFVVVALFFLVGGGAFWLLFTHPIPTLIGVFLVFLASEVLEQRRTLKTIKKTERYLKEKP